DLHVGHQNRIFNLAITVDAHTWREYAAHHPASRNDAAGGNNGIDSHTHAAAFLREDKFGRRLLRHQCAYGPAAVIKIELRGYVHQVHIGFVVSVERSHIPPITRLFGVNIHEVVGHHAVI